ncbi:hypothetical protein [Tsukamurella ocularis]|uniref:hypothetical protein n=1 Tax=Tsukamurella ocularis TaxID=1970234 RepID=UPI002166D9D0|nr:hypothetical protein [Tsukamurella ocularis]MCS3779231.1 hypothetical protein [Tsukamurella ocularis]MCS3787149.1 hypothetical protein [Tsukamurella ocularis]MCS3852540.1 hypothetical protein [Tsukamurella ocularis]
MALVRIIDVVVQYVKILGGRQKAPAVVRFAAWLLLLAAVLAAVAVVVVGLIRLNDYLATLPPTR